MPDTPLTRLLRLVGGAAMLQGPIGYQVLGNLLIAGSRSPEVAGVAAGLAVGSRQRATAAQVALRTIVPAVALHLLSEREAERLRRLAADADVRERGARAERAVLRRERGAERSAVLRAELETLAAQHEGELRRALETQAAELKTRAAAEKESLRQELETGFAESETNLRVERAEDKTAREEALVHQETLRRETEKLAAALKKASVERDALAQEAHELKCRIDRLLAEQPVKGRAGQRTAAGRGPSERALPGGVPGPTNPDAEGSKAAKGRRATKAALEPGPGGLPAKPRRPASRGRSRGD